jgi:hypothetical protein
MNDVNVYRGSELELFSEALCWKAYYGNLIRPYLVGDVLEVGAGIGATTRSLCDGSQRRWVCLEPDGKLSGEIQKLIDTAALPRCCEVLTGRISDVPRQPQFDAILYIDVLEHIEDDAAEVEAAAGRLRSGGVLIILAPAHQWLYTPFDEAIGHYRRYSKETLSRAMPRLLAGVDLRYLDSVGLLASLGNRVLLNSSMPTKLQIALWDNVMIRASRLLDPLLRNSLGKSVLGIWRRNI